MPNWTDLGYSTFHSLVISDEFNVRNEEQVLSGVLQWVAAKPPERREKLVCLLQDVRLHVVAEKVLQGLEEDPLVTSSDRCLRLICEGRDFAAKTKCDTAIKLKPRNYFDKCIYMFCQYKVYPENVRFPQSDFSGSAALAGSQMDSIYDQLKKKYSTRYSAAYQEYFNNCNILIFSKTHDRWEQHLDPILKDNGDAMVMSWAEVRT